MSGSSSVSVPLKQSEYFLQVAIESYTHELLENDIVLNEMPEASQSIHIIVKVKKSNGEIEASISIPLSSVADSTEYEELKILLLLQLIILVRYLAIMIRNLLKSFLWLRMAKGIL